MRSDFYRKQFLTAAHNKQGKKKIPALDGSQTIVREPNTHSGNTFGKTAGTITAPVELAGADFRAAVN